MSEASKSLTATPDRGIIGPDYFGYYTRETVELLSHDEDFLPLATQNSEFHGKNCSDVREKDTIDDCCNRVHSLFSNSIEVGLSDFKKERLKSLLRQGVFDLTLAVDEMLYPVIATCQLKTKIRNRKCLSSDIGAASKVHAEQVPCKKPKMSSSFSSTSIPAHGSPLNCGSCRESPTNAYRSSLGQEKDFHSGSNTGADKENGEVDEELQFHLENNSLLVEETTKKYSDELSATLGYMERKLEELLNAVVMKCRPMTLSEKQELQKLIQKLPPKNLDRVVEIVQHRTLAETQSSNEIFVDLEQEDNVTLWRLYYYVKAVEKARDLVIDYSHLK